MPQSHDNPSALSIDSLQEQHTTEPLSDTWYWALHSGQPCHSSTGEAGSVATGDVDVLLTGHDNGAVSFWDVRSVTPQRLSHVATSARPVTTIELDPVTGLLATGHSGGEVRHCPCMDGGAPGSTRRMICVEGAFFYPQLMQVNVHLWSPDGPQTDGPHILNSSARPAAHHSSERKTMGTACWEHALHISGAKAPLGSSEQVVSLAIHRRWQPMTVWLGIAFASAGVAVVDLSGGLNNPRWLWELSLGDDVPGTVTCAHAWKRTCTVPCACVLDGVPFVHKASELQCAQHARWHRGRSTVWSAQVTGGGDCRGAGICRAAGEGRTAEAACIASQRHR